MKRTILIVIFLLLASAVAGGLTTQATDTGTQVLLSPTSIAWVSSAEPGTNFGGQGYMWVGYGEGSGTHVSTLRGLVKFDLSGIPAGATVTGATLYATIWNAQGPPDHFLYCSGRVTSAWQEASVTWNNGPAMLGGGGCTDISTTSGQVSWDVTTMVRDIASGFTSNNGFYLTRENDTTDPQEHARLFGVFQLLVNYDSSTPTPTPAAPPALSIAQTDSPDPVDAGNEVVYEIRVSNTGGPPQGGIVLKDTLPEGATFVEATGGGALNDDGSVGWAIPTLAAGADYTVQVVLRTDSGLPEGIVLTNLAEVTYPCQGAAPGLIQVCRQESTETTTIHHPSGTLRTPTPTVPLCPPDEAGSDQFSAASIPLGIPGVNGVICPANDTDWYMFLIQPHVTVDVWLGDMTTDVDLYLANGDGHIFAYSAHEGLVEEHIQLTAPNYSTSWFVDVSGQRGGMGPGEYRLQVRVIQPTPTFTPTPTPTNTRIPSPTPRPTGTPRPTSTSPPTSTPTQTPVPTVELQKWLQDDYLAGGEVAHYFIHLVNRGRGTLHNVLVRDILPHHMTFDRSDPSTTPDPNNPRRIPFPTIASLRPGESADFSVDALVDTSVTVSSTLRNQAIVSADEMRAVHAESVDTVGEPRLSISAWATAPVIAPGETIHIRACVKNAGAGRVLNPVVVASFIGTDLLNIEPNSPGHYDRLANAVTWELNDLYSTHGCADLEIDADLISMLEPNHVVVVGWTATGDNVSPVNFTQRITLDSGCALPQLSWTLSNNSLGPDEVAALTVDIKNDYHQPSNIRDFTLTFNFDANLYITSSPSYCSLDGYTTLVCSLDASANTLSVPLTLKMGHEPVAYQNISMELTSVDLCFPTEETVTIWKTPDVRIHNMEVTQSIQRYPVNTVTLVEHRTTWVRAYPMSEGSTVPNVPCKLSVYRCNGSDCSQFLGDLAAESGYDSITVGPSYDRGDLHQSFLFEIPDSWTYGSLKLVPEINPADANGRHQVLEDDYTNNVGDPVQIQFTHGPDLALAWVQASYNAGGQILRTSGDSLDDDIRWMQGAFPFANVVNLGPAPVKINLNRQNFTSDQGWDDAVLWLDRIRSHCEGDSLCNVPWVLPIPAQLLGSYVGIAGITNAIGGDSIIVIDDTYDYVLGHEMGHHFGLHHGDCGGPADVDPAIPVHLEDYGLNVETLELYPPSSTYDMMTYCTPPWVSIHDYEFIHDTVFGTGAQQAASAVGTGAHQGLMVRGIVKSDQDTGQIRWAELRLRPGGPFDGSGTGAYSIELQDSGGQVLFTRHFTPTQTVATVSGGDSAPLPRLFFKEILPPQAGMTSIVLKHGSKVLDTRAISANAPTVTLAAPNGGETITGTYTATWTAGDADGDPLTFYLQISRDGGQGWLPLTGGITETSYAFDAGDLPGGSHMRLRVIANDGVRTGLDISDADFIIPNHPLRLRMLRPADGAQVRSGSTVALVASVVDQDERGLAAQVRWQSDRDGLIGTGRRVTTRDLSVGDHVITASITDSGGLTATASVGVTILPPVPSPDECTNRMVDGDFESPGWGAWAHGGESAPLITASGAVTGTHALLLGKPGGQDAQGLSWVRQMVTLPEGTIHAWLSFRYRTFSWDRSSGHDWFLAAVVDGDGNLLQVLRFQGGRSSWQTAAADLSGYAGQTIGLFFAVKNDGQAGRTWAFVDDVSLCVSAPTPPNGQPGRCGLPGGLTDYAPAGLPDFDQRQSKWRNPTTGRWSYDAATAMADLLWWRDSLEEPGNTAPPAVSDGYGLVQAYSTWDDHDSRNVRPLISDLATRMSIDQHHPGADLDDVVQGAKTYLGTVGMGEKYTLALRRSPSFDWVRAEVKQQHQVMLLLGFWELQPTGWKRIGGHYVAVAGASCNGDAITFSDPARDGAEMGWPGRVVPPGHQHDAASPHTLHNDAAYISHDGYGIMRTATGWGPQGYVRNYAEIENFAGLNFSPQLEAARANAYLGGEIVTLVDYALVLAPRSELVTMELSPDRSHVRAGESFLVEIGVQAGTQQVDTVDAYLDFDPTILRVVDANGSPTTHIIPGQTLSTVTANGVNNALGRIHFAATGDATAGRFVVATVRFQAITVTRSSAVTWSTTGSRRSDVLLAGTSALENLRAGKVEVEPGARAAGRVAMEGRPAPPDASWSVPMLLTLSSPGSRGPDYVFGTASNQTGLFPMPGVAAPGTYRVRVKGLHTLRNLLPTSLQPGTNGMQMGTLLEGDAWNDNRIDVHDLSILGAAYGTSAGSPGFDPRADFDEDDTIGADDLALLRANWGRHGDRLVSVGATSASGTAIPDIDLELLSTGPSGSPVRLSLVPTVTYASTGDILRIDLVTDSGSEPVDAVAAYLDFDPHFLAPVDAQGHPATEVQTGTALPTVLRNSVDAARGRIDLVVGSVGSTPPQGSFVVARLYFKMLKPGNGWIRFSFSSRRNTAAASQGRMLPVEVEAGRVRSLAGMKTYLPVVSK